MDNPDPGFCEDLNNIASEQENKEGHSDQFEFDHTQTTPSSPTGAEFGDSPGDRIDDMAIEDACDITWEGDSHFPSPCENALGVVPLPPPPSTYNDIHGSTRSESPTFNADLENLFSSEQHGDAIGSSVPGVCGLCNLGNTCFMNSGLQCLLNTPTMLQFFMKQLCEETSTTESLATQFTNLFNKVWSGKYNKTKPTELHQALATHHPQLKDYRQHDCQEFLALVLGTLHELLNTASSKSHVSDLSADPMTPHSTCDDEREVSGARGGGMQDAMPDSADQDSGSQMALSIAGLRCEASSSSHSSESSIGASHIRLRPLPEDVHPFKGIHSGSVLWQAMDSIIEPRERRSVMMEVDYQIEEANTNNIISHQTLKRESKVISASLEKNQVACLNNVQQCFRGYEDILKDAKTSNVNVLVTEQGANNEIVFDSDKFPKQEVVRRRDLLENPNLTEFHNFDGKTVSVKRIKETNKLHDAADGTKNLSSLDLDSTCDLYASNNKRFKLEDNMEKEKNFLMEYERRLRAENTLDGGGEFSGAAALNCSAPINVDDDLEADKQWEKHLGHNQSVIVDTFQGQFKSTVVCSECQYVSSTYEPFMYLSVPLPHAMEQQVCVTFVPANAAPSTKYLLTLNKQDKVVKIKEQLRTVLKANVSMSIELAEVLHHHIARILVDNHFIRYLGTADPNRSIYAFEISEEVICSADTVDRVEPLDLTPEPNCEAQTHRLNNVDGRKCADVEAIPSINNNLRSGSLEVPDEGDVEYGPQPEHKSEGDAGEWKSCAICLEDVDKGFKTHKGCSCCLCDSCIERSVRHYSEGMGAAGGSDGSGGSGAGQMMKCPVCNEVCPATDFTASEDATTARSSLRMLKVPVLFRQDVNDVQSLFGHPHLIKVANRIKGSDLYQVVDRLVPYNAPHFLVLVDGQGYHCSRCIYTMHCKGCRIRADTEVTLRTGDNLAVIFTSPVIEIPSIEDSSLRGLRGLRNREELTIYDCLDAFSESETLDEHNPWYCPTCQRNQCATKTLSVWRYPEFLIVYLKRFVFYEYTSVKLDMKVSFPLTGLRLTPPSRTQQGLSRPYNLYACVNHFGGASAGHYTAYAKNPQTGEWHLFNDESVTSQKPQEDDFSHAYVLFYQKQGVHFNLNLPNSLLGDTNGKPNIDQLILELDSSVEQDTWREKMGQTTRS